MAEWHGDNPVYISVQRPDGSIHVIDLDEHGWVTTHADILRSPGLWEMRLKADDRALMSMVVLDGEQAYSTTRVQVFPYRGVTLRAHGMGKKRVDGNEDNLWWMPWGVVTVGKDIDHLMEAYARVVAPLSWEVVS